MAAVAAAGSVYYNVNVTAATSATATQNLKITLADGVSSPCFIGEQIFKRFGDIVRNMENGDIYFYRKLSAKDKKQMGIK